MSDRADFYKELYRSKYYARRNMQGRPQRISLRTADPDLADSRLRELNRRATAKLKTLGEIWAKYRADHPNLSQPKRIDAAVLALSGFFFHLSPEQVTDDLCKEYAGKRARGELPRAVANTARSKVRKVGPGTIRKELSFLKAAVNHCLTKSRSPAVWWLPDAPPPKDIYLEPEHFELLLEETEKTWHLQMFIRLAIGTAGRKSAIFELLWQQVDFRTNRITLDTILVDDEDQDRLAEHISAEQFSKIQRKGRAVIPIPNKLRDHLLGAKELARTDHVIDWRDKPIRDIKTAFNKARRRCFERTRDRLWLKVTPHTLRHTAAVWMSRKGVPMEKIATYLGHTNVEITRRVYARHAPDYLDDAAGALDLF